MTKARDTADLVVGIDVDASGNVGIGTSSPQRRLHTVGADNVSSTIRLENTNVADTIWDLVPDFGGNVFKIRYGAAATDIMLLNKNGNLQFNSGYGSVATAYGCRAWGKIGAITPTIVGANFTSVTKTATGVFETTMTNAMPDASYCISAITINGNTSLSTVTALAVSTTVMRFRVFNNTGAPADINFDVAVFR